MNRYQRIVCAAALAFAVLVPAGRASAVQNWFGYGGIFGPQAYYTYYAPQPVVSAGYAAAPVPVSAYSYPTVIAAPPVVNYSAARVIIPTTAYAPLTTVYAPVTSYRPVVAYSPTGGTYGGQSCGTATCAPAMIAPFGSGPITVAPAPTMVTPSLPRYGTPIYPPPGIYPSPPIIYPQQPSVSPGLPTSSISPADQQPTMSGYPPIDSSRYVPLGTGTSASPNEPNSGAASPPSENGAKPATTSNRLQPDLDISVPAKEDETLTPVAPADSSSQDDDAAAGPRLEGDEGNTAAVGTPRTGLLSPATWRAVRPSTRRALADRKSAIRPGSAP